MNMSLLQSLRQRLFLRKHLKNEFISIPLRQYFSENYQITVGLYSYGCFDARRIPRNTEIGRYCSFAPTAVIFNGNHGLDFLSLHPYLYNTTLGFVKKETIRRTKCIVEDDVWVGHLATILPSVDRVGRGSVVAAGAVVTKNVPPYAIVAGNPARIVRYRFDPQVIEEIERTRWWMSSAEELRELIGANPRLVYSPSSIFARTDSTVKKGEVSE